MGKGSFVVAVIALLALQQCVSLPTTFFSKTDQDSAAKAILSQQKSDGTFTGLKNTFYAVASLKNLKVDVPQKDKICASVQGKQTDAESVFYSVYIVEALGCGTSSLSSGYQDVLENNLKPNTKASDLSYALAAVQILQTNKHSNVKDDTVKAAAKALIGKADDEGLIGNIYTTGIALQALAGYAKDNKDELSTLLTSAAALASQADGEDFLEFDKEEGHSALRVTSAYFRGITDLANALGKRGVLKPEQTGKFAEAFLRRKYLSALEEIFSVVEGLSAARVIIPAPLVVSLSQNYISSAAKGAEQFLKARVTDVFGNFATKTSLWLSKATGSDKKNIASNEQLAALGETDPTAFQMNFMNANPAHGLYNLEFRATPESENYINVKSVLHNLRVISEGAVSDVAVTVSDSTDSVDLANGRVYRPVYPTTEANKISVQHFQYVTVAFTVKNAAGATVTPHQAFIAINNAREDYVIPAKHDGKQFVASVSAEDLAATFEGEGGDYSLSILVGDSYLSTSVAWKAATLSLNFPESARVALRNPLSPKPEIVHRFRRPEKRPSVAVSSAFTLAVLSPFLFLFAGLIRVGANLKNFPVNSGFLWAVGFQASLGAILALFGLYWLRLDMVHTLIYLGILAVPTIFFAQKALNHLASEAKLKSA